MTFFGLVMAANELRRRMVGETVTYVVTRNINFTNVCIVGCKFCAFAVGPRTRPRTSFARRNWREGAEAARWGATEVCIQGGLPRDLPPYYYRDILQAVKAAVPTMHCHAFSPMEMRYGVELTGMPVREYLLMLKDAGLDTLPGTAAEILDDDVRQVLSRNKLSVAQWREIIETAHECGIRSTSTLMYGHTRDAGAMGQPASTVARDSVAHRRLYRVRAARIHSRQHAAVRAGPGARGCARWRRHVKVHALARVMLAGSINHIQVSWVKLGREVSQLALLAGADDYGGTLVRREHLAAGGRFVRAVHFDRQSFRNGFLSWDAFRHSATRLTRN